MDDVPIEHQVVRYSQRTYYATPQEVERFEEEMKDD